MIKPGWLKRYVVITMLLLLTALGVGKVMLPWMPELVETTMGESTLPSEPVAVLVVDVAKQWNGQWLANELIPSALAAEAMLLSEEKNISQSAEDMQAWNKKRNVLDAREKALDEKEEEVKAAQERANTKISELEQLEAKIRALLDEEASIKDKKIKRLTAVYEGMKAERAAPVIAQMELDIVVKIFSRMNEKQVGKILSFMPPQQAVVISQALTKRLGSI